MAIFNKSDQSKTDGTATTIIAAGTRIEGNLKGECRVHVDGEFSGCIISKGIISVGKTGIIEGEAFSKKLIVTGSFIGEADCEEVEIAAGGKLVGQIKSNILVIERGSFFEGENKLKDSAKRSIANRKNNHKVVPINEVI